MALKHTFVSPKTDGGDATLVQPSHWNGDHVIDANGVLMAAGGATPSTPAAGYMNMFGRLIAGGALPSFIGPSGQSSTLQPFIGRNKITLYSPLGNATAVSQVGIAVASSGTATARNVATTNLLLSTRRHGYVTPVTANSRALVNGAAQYFLSSTAGMGGFRFVARFATSDAVFSSGANMFAGLSAASSVASGGATVAAALNIIGVGADAGDTNLQLFNNDGSGTATKTDLGASFPANTTNVDLYELALFAASGGGASVGWQVTRINTGDTASGTLTTDIPAVNQLVMPILLRGNLSTGVVVGIDIVQFYIETDN